MMTKVDKAVGVNEGFSAKLGSDWGKRAQKSLLSRCSTLSAEPATKLPKLPKLLPTLSADTGC